LSIYFYKNILEKGRNLVCPHWFPGKKAKNEKKAPGSGFLQFFPLRFEEF